MDSHATVLGRSPWKRQEENWKRTLEMEQEIQRGSQDQMQSTSRYLTALTLGSKRRFSTTSNSAYGKENSSQFNDTSIDILFPI